MKKRVLLDFPNTIYVITSLLILEINSTTIMYASSWHISAFRFISLLNGALQFSNGFLLSLNPNPGIL